MKQSTYKSVCAYKIGTVTTKGPHSSYLVGFRQVGSDPVFIDVQTDKASPIDRTDAISAAIAKLKHINWSCGLSINLQPSVCYFYA